MLSRIRPFAAVALLVCALLSLLFPLTSAWAAGTVTIERIAPVQGNGNRGQFVITIVETSATSSSEITISGVPKCGTITRIRAKLTSGTGTTIRPRVGDAASFAADSYNETLAASGTAATVREPGSGPYCTSTGTLYLRNGVNAGTDNAITTEILIVEGSQG